MLIGTMNHPARDVLSEIQWMAEMGLEFLDLTLEPPRAGVRMVDLGAVRAMLERHRMPVVGHTAYYLPMASPFESLRRAALNELIECARAFARLGAKWMNLHPDYNAPLHGAEYVIERNLQTLRELLEVTRDLGVGVMIENLPGRCNTPEQLAPLLDSLPELGFHLDIGHCNLKVETSSAPALLARYGSRLKHVHLHDNKGGKDDLHAPLGTGTVDVAGAVKGLQACGYDGTITLEVFTPDRHYLAYSRDLLRKLWPAKARTVGSEREASSARGAPAMSAGS